MCNYVKTPLMNMKVVAEHQVTMRRSSCMISTPGHPIYMVSITWFIPDDLELVRIWFIIIICFHKILLNKLNCQ